MGLPEVGISRPPDLCIIFFDPFLNPDAIHCEARGTAWEVDVIRSIILTGDLVAVVTSDDRNTVSVSPPITSHLQLNLLITLDQ